MIIVYVGGIGSGKTLSMVRAIVQNPTTMFYTNFPLKNLKNWTMLKKEDFLNYITNKDGTKKPETVNWKYWNDVLKKKQPFSICIDEIHNLVSSRRSHSSRNVLMSRWVSQVRKILGDSATNHLIISSQQFRKLDIDWRELAHIVVRCVKYKKKDKVVIKNQVWNDASAYELDMKHNFSYVFTANKYFRYYDSYGFVRFGDE